MLANDLCSRRSGLSSDLEGDRGICFLDLEHISPIRSADHFCEKPGEDLNDKHRNYRRKIKHPRNENASKWLQQRLGYLKQKVKEPVSIAHAEKREKEPQKNCDHIQ